MSKISLTPEMITVTLMALQNYMSAMTKNAVSAKAVGLMENEMYFINQSTTAHNAYHAILGGE